MIRKIKHWLCHKFLPTYLRDALMGENARLREEIQKLRARIQEQDAYIDGLEAGIRAQRRIIINTSREAVK